MTASGLVTKQGDSAMSMFVAFFNSQILRVGNCRRDQEGG
jgi:hypothetical protein